jgi:hypothetical protein
MAWQRNVSGVKAGHAMNRIAAAFEAGRERGGA